MPEQLTCTSTEPSMPLQIAMLLFSDTPEFSVDALQAALSKNWPDLPSISEVTQQDDTLSFRLGVADLVIGTMPAPVPWSDLEGPCATSVLWPDATSAVRAHKMHAIISVSGPLLPVPLSLLLTQVSAALLVAVPQSLGMYWSNASLVIPKDLFTGFAIEVLPLAAPVPIWVDFRVGWNEDKTHSAGFTTGLAQLGLIDLETQAAPESPAELKKRFEAISNYLVDNGMVISDGDTVGESASEKIRIVRSKSAFGAPGEVMRLVYDAGTGKKPWWQFW